MCRRFRDQLERNDIYLDRAIPGLELLSRQPVSQSASQLVSQSISLSVNQSGRQRLLTAKMSRRICLSYDDLDPLRRPVNHAINLRFRVLSHFGNPGSYSATRPCKTMGKTMTIAKPGVDRARPFRTTSSYILSPNVLYSSAPRYLLFRCLSLFSAEHDLPREKGHFQKYSTVYLQSLPLFSALMSFRGCFGPAEF